MPTFKKKKTIKNTVIFAPFGKDYQHNSSYFFQLVTVNLRIGHIMEDYIKALADYFKAEAEKRKKQENVISKEVKSIPKVEQKHKIELNIQIPCPECKKKVDNDAIFCKYCGVNLKIRSRYIPPHVKEKVWNRDEGQCVKCGSKYELEYDHIIPFSKGGSNTHNNIQLLCTKCNRRKLNKIRF